MKKIAIITKNLEIHGISQVIINYCTTLNLNKYNLTIFASNPINKKYINICKSKEIKIVKLPKKGVKYFYKLYKELNVGKYDVVHIHGSSALVGLEVFISFICHISTRIVHSHNTTSEHPLLHYLLKPILNLLATKRIACGVDAGKWMFGKNVFEVINNGIFVENFMYSLDEKNNLKKEYNLENYFVIGHIGRFNHQKNQKFLLDIMSKLDNEKIALVMVGIGPEYESVKQEANKFKQKIIFVGETTNPAQFYNLFDIFLLPSLYEGLPVVLIEAQASGLPCLVSDCVTKEANLTGTIKFLSLNEEKKWNDEILLILNDKNKDRKSVSQRNIEILKSKGFDINNNSEKIERIYDE